MTEPSKPIHPGKILYEQAMQPLGVSRNKLARDIDVPVGRISDIVAGKRGITPDTALRLGKYFGTSAEMWMQFQSDHDLFVARNSEWPNIAPRVREMQPIDPNAVAPVTEMDGYADASTDTEPREDVPSTSGDAAETTTEAHDDGDEKWWSTSLSDPAADPSGEEIAPGIESPEPSLAGGDDLDETDAVESTAADVDLSTEQPLPRRTVTLGVKSSGESAKTVEGEPASLSGSEPDASATEQTFEIGVRPATADSRVVADNDGATDEADQPASPQRRFTVDVVREATQALESSVDADGAPTDPVSEVLEPEPLDEDGLTIEFDEDDLARELPGDAFASELDEDAIAEEVVEAHQQEFYAPAIARTGTDDFGPLDPPLSGPGLDVATGTSASFEPGTEAPTEIGGLTPANWSSALESARQDDPNVEEQETSGPASGDSVAAAETDDHFDVPLPSEFEPAMEGPLRPWSPEENDDPLVSLDIPEPEDARKLYEYDD